MSNPTTSEVNPFSEIWPLEHNAEIWGHRRTADVFKPDPPEKGEGDIGNTSQPGKERHEAHRRRDKPPRQPHEYYGSAEIFAALSDLSEGEIEHILSFARFRLMGRAQRHGPVEAGDLFSDASIRTMEGDRNWSRGVSRFNHLCAVMRSIGCQRFKEAARYMPLNELLAAPQHWSLSALDAKASVARLREQLRGDAIALNVLDSMMDEMRPRDTQRFLGIRAEVYWAARKRIRRQAEKLPGAFLFSGAHPTKKPSPAGRVFQCR